MTVKTAAIIALTLYTVMLLTHSAHAYIGEEPPPGLKAKWSLNLWVRSSACTGGLPLAAFSPDAKTILVSNSRAAYLLNAGDGRVREEVYHTSPPLAISSIALNPLNPTEVAIGTSSNLVIVNASDKTIVYEAPRLEGSIFHIAYLADGRGAIIDAGSVLHLVDLTRKLIVWTTRTIGCPGLIATGNSGVFAVAGCPSCPCGPGCSASRLLTVHRLGDGEKLWSIKLATPIRDVEFSATGKTLYVALANGTINSYEALTGRPITTYSVGGHIVDLEVVGEGTLAVLTSNGTIAWLDTGSWETIWKAAPEKRLRLKRNAVLSPKGDSYIVSYERKLVFIAPGDYGKLILQASPDTIVELKGPGGKKTLHLTKKTTIVYADTGQYTITYWFSKLPATRLIFNGSYHAKETLRTTITHTEKLVKLKNPLQFFGHLVVKSTAERGFTKTVLKYIPTGTTIEIILKGKETKQFLIDPGTYSILGPDNKWTIYRVKPGDRIEIELTANKKTTGTTKRETATMTSTIAKTTATTLEREETLREQTPPIRAEPVSQPTSIRGETVIEQIRPITYIAFMALAAIILAKLAGNKKGS